jgi:dipeptidase
MRVRNLLALTLTIATVAGSRPISACTNLLVTKGASADGSTMITYAADSHDLYGYLQYTPPALHRPGEMRDIYDWDSGKFLGRVRQAAVTYSVVGNMNEFQVSVGETTYGGRKELEGPAGIVDYGSLMYIALERARTAREAIQIMAELVAEYGYASEGESFSIADPNEVWEMDLIGKSEKAVGAVWVARRVPDGYIGGHANQARIRTFPLNDPANCLYAKDVVSFARDKGWFSGKDEEFSFADTYAPLSFGAVRFCEARVWSAFRRAAPSLALKDDYVKGVPGAEPLPLFVKPDAKLSVRDVISLMRDHFEGTELDMTQGIGAGPYACPYRWRPLTWKVGDQEYLNERAISTQQTGFSFVSQARSWLPNPIGGIHWFGLDDTYSTVYVPMYCGIRAVPKSFGVDAGDFTKFSWDSAWWTFNFVANWAYSRYSYMIVDIQKVQNELEGMFFADQAENEKAALDLYKTSPALARTYLTDYCVRQGDMVTARWRKLGEFLLWKYLDGNLRDEKGNVTHPPYPESWYKAVAAASGDALKVREFPTPTPTPKP